MWSSLLQLCLLVPSIDFEISFSTHQPVSMLLLGPTCKFKVSAVISFHNPHSTPKGCLVQAPLLCCRTPPGCLLHGKLAVPPAFPPAVSPGSFRQICGLNLSLTCSCPLSATLSGPSPDLLVLSLCVQQVYSSSVYLRVCIYRFICLF